MEPEKLDYLVKWLFLALWLWSGFGYLGFYTARECRRSVIEGVMFGVLLGPLGAILVALLPRGDD